MKGLFVMNLRLKTIVYVGILSAVASVLMIFPHFPIFPAPADFLDVDFSDVPALLASVTINPVAGVIVVLIKNLFHLLQTKTFAVGELSNLILGSVYALSVGILARYTFKKTLMKKKLFFVLPIAVIAVIITAALSNFFIVLPFYAKFMPALAEVFGKFEFILTWIVPFNLIKASLQAVVFYLLYRGVGPYVTKNMTHYR
ncbi:MAG: ECF transporter S component [Ruminococcaceae bacterium]|nr:ECF transporter S component [Oscillospiraceae bacterium]